VWGARHCRAKHARLYPSTLQKRSAEKSIVAALRDSDDAADLVQRRRGDGSDAGGLCTAPGSVLYTRAFALDRAPSHGLTQRSPGELEEFSIPLYDALGENGVWHDSVNGEDGAGAGPGCYNCGERGHGYRECTECVDHSRVRAARSEQAAGHVDYMPQGGRYYPAGGVAIPAAQRWPQYRPGTLSAALRAALGLPADAAPNAPPPFLDRMRRAGYPPGYLDPLPDGSRALHWGYADNGPVSAFVRQFDAGYDDFAARASADGVGHGPAGMALQGSHGLVLVDATGNGDPTGTHVDTDVEEGEVAAASPPAPTRQAVADGGPHAASGFSLTRGPDLWSVPGAAGMRLTQFHPVCTCGRALLADVPGLSVPLAFSVQPNGPGPSGSPSPSMKLTVPPIVTPSWCVLHRAAAAAAPQLPRMAVQAADDGGDASAAHEVAIAAGSAARDLTANAAGDTDEGVEAALAAGASAAASAGLGSQRLQRYLQPLVRPEGFDDAAAADPTAAAIPFHALAGTAGRVQAQACHHPCGGAAAASGDDDMDVSEG
jgi:hypothetical protein